MYVLKDKLNSLTTLLQLGAHTMILVVIIYAISSDLGMCLAYLGIFLFTGERLCDLCTVKALVQICV